MKYIFIKTIEYTRDTVRIVLSNCSFGCKEALEPCRKGVCISNSGRKMTHEELLGIYHSSYRRITIDGGNPWAQEIVGNIFKKK